VSRDRNGADEYGNVGECFEVLVEETRTDNLPPDADSFVDNTNGNSRFCGTNHSNSTKRKAISLPEAETLV